MFDRHQNRYVLDYRDLYSYRPGDNFKHHRKEPVDNDTSIVLGHEDLVSTSYISADGHHLVTGSYDRTVKYWKVNAGGEADCIKSMPLIESSSDTVYHGHKGWVLAVILTKDEEVIISGGYDRKIKIWSAKTGEYMRQFSGHDGAINCLCLVKKDQILCSGSLDKTIILWDLVDNERLWTIKVGQPVNCMVVNSFSTKLFVGSWGEDVTIYDLTETGDYEEMKFESLGRAWETKFGANHEQVWVDKGLTANAHKSEVTCLSISLQDHTLLSGSSDETVKLWRIEDREEHDPKLIKTFDSFQSAIQQVSFAPSHRFIFVLTAHAQISIHSVKEATCLHVFDHFTGSFLHFRFPSDVQDDGAEFWFYPFVAYGTRKIFVEQILFEELDDEHNLLDEIPVTDEENEEEENEGSALNLDLNASSGKLDPLYRVYGSNDEIQKEFDELKLELTPRNETPVDVEREYSISLVSEKTVSLDLGDE